jgi:hypothetical protein
MASGFLNGLVSLSHSILNAPFITLHSLSLHLFLVGEQCLSQLALTPSNVPMSQQTQLSSPLVPSSTFIQWYVPQVASMLN